MTDQKETTKPAHRRGHNAMVTGLAMFVIGLIMAIAYVGGMQGFGILITVAGFVTGMIGVGMRRER